MKDGGPLVAPAGGDPPRRVLMTADPMGGVWTYALDLVPALAEHGVEVVLATMGARLDETQRLAAEARGLEVRESEYQLEWMPGAWSDVDRAGAWLLDLAEREGAELVHLNGYCHAALPWRRPVLVVAHSCVWSWWRAVQGGTPPAEWCEYRERVRAGLAAADRVVAPTRAMLRALEELYLPLPHGQVIWNGRDPQAARPGRKEPFVLAAGRLWDEAKNLAALDRAAARVSWPVRVAGEVRHPDGREVRPQHAEALGRLTPAELAGWMERAALFAAPARYEPFGLTAVEAGLAGCALVLGDIPSLREVWGEAACFVPPEDPDTLATALEQLAGDPERRGQLGAAARLRALALDPARMAAAYAATYTEIMADRAITGVIPAVAAGAGAGDRSAPPR